MEFQTKICQEGAPAEVINSRRSLMVVEHLGGKTMQMKARRGHNF
jgi:hypothetical protein